MNRKNLSALVDRVRNLPVIDAGHAFDHTWRVAKSCEDFARKEKLSAVDGFLAGLLHDCVPMAKSDPRRKQSADLCADLAHQWLVEFGCEETRAQMISDAIRDHSYSSGRKPRNVLGQCLQDADRLEALGAIGLYRCLATGVQMGAKLFHSDDPFGKNRDWDDRAYSVDHFFTKLLKLEKTFHSKQGRKEAKKRTAFLRLFLKQLKSEVG